MDFEGGCGVKLILFGIVMFEKIKIGISFKREVLIFWKYVCWFLSICLENKFYVFICIWSLRNFNSLRKRLCWLVEGGGVELWETSVEGS